MLKNLEESFGCIYSKGDEKSKFIYQKISTARGRVINKDSDKKLSTIGC